VDSAPESLLRILVPQDIKRRCLAELEDFPFTTSDDAFSPFFFLVLGLRLAFAGARGVSLPCTISRCSPLEETFLGPKEPSCCPFSFFANSPPLFLVPRAKPLHVGFCYFFFDIVLVWPLIQLCRVFPPPPLFPFPSSFHLFPLRCAVNATVFHMWLCLSYSLAFFPPICFFFLEFSQLIDGRCFFDSLVCGSCWTFCLTFPFFLSICGAATALFIVVVKPPRGGWLGCHLYPRWFMKLPASCESRSFLLWPPGGFFSLSS